MMNTRPFSTLLGYAVLIYTPVPLALCTYQVAIKLISTLLKSLKLFWNYISNLASWWLLKKTKYVTYKNVLLNVCLNDLHNIEIVYDFKTDLYIYTAVLFSVGPLTAL
jgi:hypothetical protein